MASGPMHVTVPLPDLLAHAGKAKAAAKAATQEYRTLTAEIKKAQAAGQSIGADKMGRLSDLERIIGAQKEIISNQKVVKDTIKDFKTLKFLMGAHAVKSFLSGDISGVIEGAALFAASKKGQKLLGKVVGGSAGTALASALPVAGVVASLEEALFDKLIKDEDLRKESAKALSETIDLGKDNFLDESLNRRIRDEAREDYIKKLGMTEVALSAEDEEKIAKEGHGRVAKLLRARKFFDEIASAGDKEVLAGLNGKLSEEARQRFIDGVLDEITPEVLAGKLARAEAEAKAEQRKEQLRIRNMTPSQRFAEHERNRREEIEFQRRRGVVPLRYGD